MRMSSPGADLVPVEFGKQINAEVLFIGCKCRWLIPKYGNSNLPLPVTCAVCSYQQSSASGHRSDLSVLRGTDKLAALKESLECIN